ncbi:MAG: 6-phosphogluconolactonase [Campylobacter sp.]|nr:6-phosphogluconolactonase [Campylobacter sp.]
MAFNFYEFTSNKECDKALVKELLIIAHKEIQSKNNIHLAFSGGKSPISFFELLNEQDLAWEKVNISLVDERIVETSHKDSNTALLHHYLLKNKAKKAHFIPLIEKADLSYELLLDFAKKHYKQPDFAVLGMGTDGHTASLFADAKEFQYSLECEDAIVLINPKNAPYSRLSMSFSALFKCQKLFLLIQGKEKKEIFDKAILDKKLSFPISHIIHSQKVQCDVYYSR